MRAAIVSLSVVAAVLTLSGCGPSADQVEAERKLHVANEKACAEALEHIRAMEEASTEGTIERAVAQVEAEKAFAALGERAELELAPKFAQVATALERGVVDPDSPTFLAVDLPIYEVKLACEPDGD